jgi:hypothetical protein
MVAFYRPSTISKSYESTYLLEANFEPRKAVMEPVLDKTSLSLRKEYGCRLSETSSAITPSEENGYLPMYEFNLPRNRVDPVSAGLFIGYVDLAKVYLQKLVLALAPSFIPNVAIYNATESNLHSTSYLDGLRGMAALIVYINHLVVDWFPSLRTAYGSYDQNYHVLQLPILRIFFSGRGMVAVFFVISGYVLSIKSLRLMRQLQLSDLLDSLASSTFRRGIRLFLPTTASTFLSMLLCYGGFYTWDPEYYNIGKKIYLP